MKMSLETQFYKIIWKKNHERWDVVTLKMMLAVMCPPVATMTVLVVVVVVLILMVVATLLLWRNTTLCLSVNRPLGEATCNTVSPKISIFRTPNVLQS